MSSVAKPLLDMTIYKNVAEIIGIVIAIYGIVVLFLLPRSQLVDGMHHNSYKGHNMHKGHNKGHKRHNTHAHTRV
jgi:hypothetical protein